MISQRCPKCLSKRVRRGYQKTPFLMKIFFRYYLLCDSCNWEFTGFAVPGTVTAKPNRYPQRTSIAKKENLKHDDLAESNKFLDENPKDLRKVKKKVKIKF